jgi:hypothetical protein
MSFHVGTALQRPSQNLGFGHAKIFCEDRRAASEIAGNLERVLRQEGANPSG